MLAVSPQKVGGRGHRTALGEPASGPVAELGAWVCPLPNYSGVSHYNNDRSRWNLLEVDCAKRPFHPPLLCFSFRDPVSGGGPVVIPVLQAGELSAAVSLWPGKHGQATHLDLEVQYLSFTLAPVFLVQRSGLEQVTGVPCGQE